MESKAGNSVVVSDLKKLNTFVKELSATCRDYSVHIGIFGNKAQRKKGEVTNPELGVIHEFGSPAHGIPPRSFLRMPLAVKSSEIVAQVKTTENWKNLEHGKPLPVLKDLGHACEAFIEESFDTGGFGTWAALKSRKGSPLVDTGQLRRSVTSKVVKA